MRDLRTAHVLDVHHWSDRLFSFRTTRDDGLRFESGQFLMMGLREAERPIMRAYSVASAKWEETLEFFSIKVPGGRLTSRLQRLAPGDEVVLSSKPTGSLLIHDLEPGRNLYLLATGTGLAPFLSIIKDPETYERFERVIVAHGVRRVADLAYHDHIAADLPGHELLGGMIREQLLYYPAVTREPFHRNGRLTDLLRCARMPAELGLEALDPSVDRAMLCGGEAMLDEFRALLDARGFRAARHIGDPGQYVFERAFVER